MRRLIPHISVYQPNGWSNAILPIDVLHKLVNEMNGVIDIVNHMEDESVERAKEYTDSQIDIVEASIASTNNNLDQINQSLQASIRSLNHSITVLDSEVDTLVERINTTDARVTENYNTFTSAMNQVYRDLNSTATQLRNYADLKDTVLREQLEAEIEELRHVINDILEVETIDGLTGLKRTVRQILSTYIIDKVKRRGGNRFAMTWGQLSDNNNYGWFNKQNTNVKGCWHLIAPTWYNFKLLTTALFTAPPVGFRNSGAISTWGAFVNNTLLYIMYLSYHIGNNTNSFFSSFDSYEYTQWNTYRNNGTTKPTYTLTSSETPIVSGSSITYRTMVKEQAPKSILCFNTGLSLWLYNSADETYSLFDTSTVSYLYLLLIGADFEKAYTRMVI